MDKILIFDAMNAMHRARFPFNDGNYSIVFNFFRNIRPLIEQFSPDKVFFVFEGHPKFRHELYADYKANRIIKTASEELTEQQKLKQEEMVDFYRQAQIIIQLLKFLPVSLVKAENYEADDTIATLCEDLKEENITIISSDTDFIQLLQKGYKNIGLYNPIKKEFLEPPEYPYVVWKSLAGDKTDNIPKILTEGKATKICNDPSKLEQFLSLEENRSLFSINKRLIEFAIVPQEELIIDNGECNFEKLKEDFHFMEFNSIINDKSWNKYINTFNCIRF